MTMKTIRGVALALAALGLCSVISPNSLPAANAQEEQTPPPPGGGFDGGPGGFGGGPGGPQGGRQGQGRFGGGQGGFAGGGRFMMGTVNAVDQAAKTITVTSPFAGTQTIQVSDTTQVVAQATATVADLKVGDRVQVQGVPTSITASALTIGQNPLAAGPGGGQGRDGAAGGFGGRTGGGFSGPGGANGQSSFATATGTVTATSPLMISLSTSVSLALKLAPSAKVTRYSPVTLSSIKTGDQIVGTGQAGDNGMFMATTVGVNMTMGNGGGGFDGPGGRQGQGRFNGPQGGPGGFGGPGGPGNFGMPQGDGPRPPDPNN